MCVLTKWPWPIAWWRISHLLSLFLFFYLAPTRPVHVCYLLTVNGNTKHTHTHTHGHSEAHTRSDHRKEKCLNSYYILIKMDFAYSFFFSFFSSLVVDVVGSRVFEMAWHGELRWMCVCARIGCEETRGSTKSKQTNRGKNKIKLTAHRTHGAEAWCTHICVPCYVRRHHPIKMYFERSKQYTRI